jgi:hypothetical protein
LVRVAWRQKFVAASASEWMRRFHALARAAPERATVEVRIAEFRRKPFAPCPWADRPPAIGHYREIERVVSLPPITVINDSFSATQLHITPPHSMFPQPFYSHALRLPRSP